MLIELSKIHPSPKPIRTSWDEEAMKNLSWSLREEGQVEPIGVHENSHGYVIVWGHRRVEAARRAQWTQIEAVVVPADEVNNLIQAGIENLSGEDMSAEDKAEWAYRLVELGLSQNEISRRSTVPVNTISVWLLGKREKDAGVFIDEHGKKDTRDEGSQKVVMIAQVLGNDLEAKKAIASKVSDDRLNREQTRSVAEAYRDAPTPAVKAQVLKTPIISRDTSADILRRSINRVEIDSGVKVVEERNEWDKERAERREMSAWDDAVKEFLDATRLYAQIAQKVPGMIKYAKYSPEAARFAIRKIDTLIDMLKTAREELERVE